VRPTDHLRRALSLTATLATLASLATTAAIAQQPPASIDAVLHQLDLASTSFRSAEANLRIDMFERVVQDTSTECGVIYYLRQSSSIQMDSKTSAVSGNSCPDTSFTAPASRIADYKNGTLQMFEPLANHLTILSAGANQGQIESFLTLGFGASGRDLAKAWTITEQGTETLNDGSKEVATVKLKLVAKDPAILKNLSYVLIWVDPARGLSLKQQFFTPAGDYRTTYFTNIRYNQKVDTATFAIKTNKQTQVDRH